MLTGAIRLNPLQFILLHCRCASMFFFSLNPVRNSHSHATHVTQLPHAIVSCIRHMHDDVEKNKHINKQTKTNYHKLKPKLQMHVSQCVVAIALMCVCAVVRECSASPNGLGLKPAMGTSKRD